MFLSYTDFLNAKLTADAKLNESEILKTIINEDIGDKKKAKMAEGERYYAYEHDILNRDFSMKKISETVTGDDGEEREQIRTFSNPNRSNAHTVNGFHRVLVDQKTAYLLGKPPVVTVKGSDDKKEYQRYVDETVDEEFCGILQEMVIGASNKGFETLHFYYDREGRLKYCIVPAQEVIPIYDSTYENELCQLIRYYDITVIKNGRRYTRKKAEWWTKDDVTYYIENEDRQFVLDSSVGYNPSPHWWTVEKIDGTEKKRKAHSWGRVPFLILKNNSKCTTDLEGIKGLIDAYDALSSEGVNNLLDLVELYWVIEGYGGEAASAIAKKLQINKAVHVNDSSGSVEARQIDLPMEGRISYLKFLRRDIFQFGQGLDIDINKYSSAPSGTSLKFQYVLLDLKADCLAVGLRRVIKDMFFFITADKNNRDHTDFDPEMLNVLIKKTMVTNDAETVDMIEKSRGFVSDKTLLSHHPFVANVTEEMNMADEEKKEDLEDGMAQ